MDRPSSLQVYYWRLHFSWAVSYAYNPFLTVILLIIYVITSLAINFGDLLILCFARALYPEFKALINRCDQHFSQMRVSSHSGFDF